MKGWEGRDEVGVAIHIKSRKHIILKNVIKVVNHKMPDHWQFAVLGGKPWRCCWKEAKGYKSKYAQCTKTKT